MKAFVNHFVSVMKRSKVATILNIGGLSVAFAAFIIILSQLNFERKFDRCHPTANRIFRVDLSISGVFSTIFPRAFVEEVIHSSPHIVAGTLLTPSFGHSGYYLAVDKKGEQFGFKEVITTCHATLPRIFDFPIVEGTVDCLNDPEKVMIPLSLAEKLYGKEPVVGKSLYAKEPIWTKSGNLFTIGAVYRDFPQNTQLRNVIYTAIDPGYNRDNFKQSNWVCYLLLDDAASADIVADTFNEKFDFKKINRPDEHITLVALEDIYYKKAEQDGGIFRNGSREASVLLFAIGILIVIIAAINFTNFHMALVPLRVKSVNTRKVMGGSNLFLRTSLLIEAAGTAFMAWLLGVFWVWEIHTTQLLSFIDSELSLSANVSVLLVSAVVALLIGVAAGFYPSFYVTSFPPALVLKGSFGLSPSGKTLRTMLIGVQFIISIVLIVVACFMELQSDYIRRFSLGFDKDQLAIVYLNSDLYVKHHETYANRLRENPGIEDVAFCTEEVGTKDGYNTNTATYGNYTFSYYMILSSPNFLKVMGIPVEEGRDFTLADRQSNVPSYIFNKAARDGAEMREGEAFGRGRIIGFTGDVKFSSLREGADKIAFVTGNFSFPLRISFVRLKAGSDFRASVAYIREVVKELDPAFPLEIQFYDEAFDRLYHREEMFRDAVFVFGLLAIIISLAGVFSMVVFDTQYRRKEIGIRKVYGAEICEIIMLFNNVYLKIVLVCSIIAVPIAWFTVLKWLENFAYKTPIYVWVFIAALLVIFMITLLTVSFQSWKAAVANPVESIKSE